MTLPGHDIRRWASRVFSPLTMARVIDPMLADLQFECGRAHAAGKLWRARWIQFTGYGTCARVVALYGSLSAWRVVRETSRDDCRAVRRVAVFTTLFVVVITGLFAGLPFLALLLADPRDLAVTLSDDPAERIRLFTLLLPQALPTAIPVALVLGVSIAIGSRRLSPRVTAAALALAFCASLVSFGAMGWGAPLANQEFRTTLAGAYIPKGLAELTLGELRSNRSRMQVMLQNSPLVMAPIFIARSDLRYHRNYALPAASIVLLLFLLARRRSGNRLLLASQAAIACGLYYVLMETGDLGTRDGWMNGIAAAWLPNVLFLAAAATLLFRSRYRAVGV